MFGKTVAVLTLAAACLVASAPAGLASSTAAGENSPWAQTNAGAAQNRANLTEKVLSTSSVANVKYLRNVVAPKRPVNRYCGRQGIVSPVLAGGDLYAATNYVLSKYNAATGALIWRVNPDKSLSTVYDSLALAQNLVIVGGYFCESESEPDGFVAAFNASTGKLAWSSSAGAIGLGGAVVSGSYVVTAGDSAYGYQESVLSLSTGELVWANGDCGNGGPTSTPLVVGGLVMGYGCDSQGNETLTASDLATGTVAWTLSGSWRLWRGDLDTSAGTHLYATDPSGAVVALNPQTGQMEYTLSQATSVLAVGEYRVYATCGTQGICAYNLSTGALDWQDTQFPQPALVAEAHSVLYLDSGIALNVRNGQHLKTIWVPSSSVPRATALAVGDGRIAAAEGPRVLDLYGLAGY